MAALWYIVHTATALAASSFGPYILTRAENYTTFPSNGETMLHYDLWMISWKTPGVFDTKFAQLRANFVDAGYPASLGIGINHPPPGINTACRYFNSFGQQAQQLQVGGGGGAANGVRTDGTGIAYPFCSQAWPQIEAYFAQLAKELFVTHAVPAAALRVVRIGMDKTGEFNYPYSSIVGGATTNNSWWGFKEGGEVYDDYPAACGSWKPGMPSKNGEAKAFVEWYYAKLAAFQDFMVGISLKYFPNALPAVLYPGSSPRVQPVDVTAAINNLAAGHTRIGTMCKHGDCPDPIAGGWARGKLIPSLAKASPLALAWHTGCEQTQASGPVFALAEAHGLHVGCENSGGIFDKYEGKEYAAHVTDFFTWSHKHNATVTFLITNSNASFYSNYTAFVACEQAELAEAEEGRGLDQKCFDKYCVR